MPRHDYSFFKDEVPGNLIGILRQKAIIDSVRGSNAGPR